MRPLTETCETVARLAGADERGAVSHRFLAADFRPRARSFAILALSRRSSPAG
jgi:hypothetical protein